MFFNYRLKSFYYSTAASAATALVVCNNNNNKNKNDHHSNHLNDDYKSKYEMLRSIIPYAYCSTVLPSSTTHIRIDNSNIIVNFQEENDVDSQKGYNYNRHSSYASYPANDPCEDRIAIFNASSYRIGIESIVCYRTHCINH